MLFEDVKTQEWSKQLFKGIADQLSYQRQYMSILDPTPRRARGTLYRINDINPLVDQDAVPESLLEPIGEYLAEEVQPRTTQVTVKLSTGYAFQFAARDLEEPSPEVTRAMQARIAQYLARYAEQETKKIFLGAGMPENTIGQLQLQLKYDPTSAQAALERAAQALGEDAVKGLGNLAQDMEKVGFAVSNGMIAGLQRASEELQRNAWMRYRDWDQGYELPVQVDYMNWEAIDRLFGGLYYRPSAMAFMSTPKERSKFSKMAREFKRIAELEAQVERGYIRLGVFAPRYHIPRKMRNKIVKVKRK